MLKDQDIKKDVVNWVISFILLSIIFYVAGFIWHAGLDLYHRYADISHFYVNKGYLVEDVCVGDRLQQMQSIRFVYGTDTGYAANIIRELYIINTQTRKIYEQQASPFIEYVEDGITYRVQPIPKLEVGTYQWILNFTNINIHGQLRTDVPSVISNEFEVKLCN